PPASVRTRYETRCCRSAEHAGPPHPQRDRTRHQERTHPLDEHRFRLSLLPWQAAGAHLLFQSRDTEDRVRCAVAVIAAAFDDFEEEAFTEGAAVELEILAVLILIVKDVFRFEPFRQLGI